MFCQEILRFYLWTTFHRGVKSNWYALPFRMPLTLWHFTAFVNQNCFSLLLVKQRQIQPSLSVQAQGMQIYSLVMKLVWKLHIFRNFISKFLLYFFQYIPSRVCPLVRLGGFCLCLLISKCNYWNRKVVLSFIFTIFYSPSKIIAPKIANLH